MQGIFQKRHDLQNASLDELRTAFVELLNELSFRFSSISMENFGEEDFRKFAEAVLTDGKKDGAVITITDGVVTITADEINMVGDVYINGSPA